MCIRDRALAEVGALEGEVGDLQERLYAESLSLIHI